MLDGFSSQDKHVVDVVAASTSVGAFTIDKLADAIPSLPSIAVALTIVWTLIRIWETDTIKKITGRGSNGETTDND